MSGITELSDDLLEELQLLLQFNPDCSQQGIKVHQHGAEPNLLAACSRLFAKGLITQADGGYLTSLGHSAVEHARALLLILHPRLH